ncbi:MAG: GTP-binding protein, partial [Euryarchaeota archaeon]|nr:GTP-binding protein [Euryarchaeota archaeon]
MPWGDRLMLPYSDRQAVERRRKTIPTILTSEEILDKSFRRVAGIKKKGTDRLDGAKKTAIAKITASADIVSSTLDRYVKAFPSFEKGEEFRLEIVDVLVGVDKLKKSLGALAWCARRSSELGRDYLSRIRKASEVSEVLRLKKEFYGRLSSIVNQIQEELRFVSSARDKLRRMPTIDLSVPTVVIAGYPNVGKSQLVERISTAKPLIATYPFTTKGIGVGHFTGGWRRYQVIDTPGLLDRTLEERNRI